MDIAPNAVVVPMLPTATVTLFEQYPTNRTKATYWSKLSRAFRAVNGHGEGREYSVRKGVHGHVMILHNEDVIFITENRPYSIRNLYLELHSCGYDVGLWYVQRNQGAFNSEDYRSEGMTPPEFV